MTFYSQLQLPPVDQQNVAEAERIMLSITPADLTFVDVFAYSSKDSKWWQVTYAGNKNNKPCAENLEFYKTLFQHSMPKCGQLASFGILYESINVRKYQLIVYHVAETDDAVNTTKN